MAQVYYPEGQLMPAIPPVRGWRWRNVKPCGTAAAYRRHFRRGGSELPVDKDCAAWHAKDERERNRNAYRNVCACPTGACICLQIPGQVIRVER